MIEALRDLPTPSSVPRYRGSVGARPASPACLPRPRGKAGSRQGRGRAVRVGLLSNWDRRLRESGLVVAGSYGPLAEKVFRLGHMGSQADMELMNRALDVIADAL